DKPVFADGAFVEASSRSVTAFDLKTKRERWSFKREVEFMRRPLVKDGIVYVLSMRQGTSRDPDTRYLYGLDLATGKKLWKSKASGKEADGMSAPMTDGKVVCVMGWQDREPTGYVRAFDVKTGARRWDYRQLNDILPAAPMVAKGRVSLVLGSGMFHSL